jgi:hypothetical protein
VEDEEEEEEEEEQEDCSANPKCLKPTGKEVGIVSFPEYKTFFFKMVKLGRLYVLEHILYRLV